MIIKTKDFLIIFSNIIKNSNKLYSSDRALYLLLVKYEKELPDTIEDINWFHKMFRQIDITEEKYIDTIIWNLIGCSEYIWYVYENYSELRKRYSLNEF